MRYTVTPGRWEVSKYFYSVPENSVECPCQKFKVEYNQNKRF